MMNDLDIDIGVAKLPPKPRDMVIYYAKKISDIEENAWIPKTRFQKHVRASHQTVEKILEDLVKTGTLEQRRHGPRLYYRFAP